MVSKGNCFFKNVRHPLRDFVNCLFLFSYSHCSPVEPRLFRLFLHYRKVTLPGRCYQRSSANSFFSFKFPVLPDSIQCSSNSDIPLQTINWSLLMPEDPATFVSPPFKPCPSFTFFLNLLTTFLVSGKCFFFPIVLNLFPLFVNLQPPPPRHNAFPSASSCFGLRTSL